MVFARSKAEWRLAEPEPTSPAAKTPGTSVRATACSRWQENSRFLDSAVKPISAQITAASWAPGVWRGRIRCVSSAKGVGNHIGCSDRRPIFASGPGHR